MFCVLGNCAVHHCWAFADLYERQACIGVTVVTQGCCSCYLRAALCQKACFVSWATVLCITVGHLQNCMKRNLHRFEYADTRMLQLFLQTAVQNLLPAALYPCFVFCFAVLHFIQLCSDLLTARHCFFVQLRLHAVLVSAALQNRLTTPL